MKSVTAGQMRELDRRAIEDFGIPGEVLMERAGRGLADSVVQRAGWIGAGFRGVAAVAGRGNNGGDAFAAARILKEYGMHTELFCVCDAGGLRGDALTHFQRMIQSGVPVHVLPGEDDWRNAGLHCAGMIIMDGLLGTGTRGEVHGVASAVIDWINRMKGCNRVVAIDVPSGLDADKGSPCGAAVEADWTVTMGLPKCGLLMQGALKYGGNIEVVDIGIPPQLTEGIGDGVSLITADEVRPLVPVRRAESHKGSHGSVLIIAGSARFPGAAVLAAMGGVRSGAGMVHVVTANEAVPAVAAAVPEAVVRGVSCDDSGAMQYAGIIRAIGDPAGYDCITAGPGLTQSNELRAMLEWVAVNVKCGMVFDADALNIMAGSPLPVLQKRADVVITPHPGEAGRLIGCSADEVQGDRVAAFRKLTELYSGTVVLKGAGSLVGSGRVCCINLTGNAGMAKGGSGDVLAGLLGGLAASGLKVADAARLAVFLHGRAGDIAAFRGSMHGMTAGDLAGCLPLAFASL